MKSENSNSVEEDRSDSFDQTLYIYIFIYIGTQYGTYIYIIYIYTHTYIIRPVLNPASSFSFAHHLVGKNGHLLLICSSLSTNQTYIYIYKAGMLLCLDSPILVFVGSNWNVRTG